MYYTRFYGSVPIFSENLVPESVAVSYYYGNNYIDMVCYDLNDVFTAELAESAEKNHIFIMPLRILPLRALRSRAQRAVNLYLNNHELIGRRR